MKPSIGRIVHFCYSGMRIPAIVTQVWSDTCVNLMILGESRCPLTNYVSSSYAQESPESAGKPNNMDTEHGTWTWPPRV